MPPTWTITWQPRQPRSRSANDFAKDHEQDPLGHDILGLEDEIQEDQALLTAARTKLPSDESVVKKAVGLGGSALDWARDRSPFLRPPHFSKTSRRWPSAWGKRLLWGTLARVAHSDEQFADLDLDGLSARAEAQERTLLELRATAIVGGDGANRLGASRASALLVPMGGSGKDSKGSGTSKSTAHPLRFVRPPNVMSSISLSFEGGLPYERSHDSSWPASRRLAVFWCPVRWIE